MAVVHNERPILVLMREAHKSPSHSKCYRCSIMVRTSCHDLILLVLRCAVYTRYTERSNLLVSLCFSHVMYFVSF